MIACHDPGSFKRPDDYLPDRWLQDDSKSSCRSGDAGGNIVVPFGIGKRQCPGRRFVEMELILILAKVSGSLSIAASSHSQQFLLSLVSVGPIVRYQLL